MEGRQRQGDIERGRAREIKKDVKNVKYLTTWWTCQHKRSYLQANLPLLLSSSLFFSIFSSSPLFFSPLASEGRAVNEAWTSWIPSEIPVKLTRLWILANCQQFSCDWVTSSGASTTYTQPPNTHTPTALQHDIIAYRRSKEKNRQR